MKIHYIATVGKKIHISPFLWIKYNNIPMTEVTDPISFGFFKAIIEKEAPHPQDIKVTLLHTADPDSKENTEIIIENLGKLVENIEKIEIPAFDSEKIVHVIMNMSHDNQKIILNVTSGTNPMHAGMWRSGLTLLEQNKPVKLLYIKEFKSERKQEKGTSITMEIIEVETDTLLARNYYEQGRKVFEQGNYTTAMQFFELAEHVYDATLSFKASAFKNLSRCYIEWDDFNHITMPRSEVKAADYYLNEAITYFKRIQNDEKEAIGWISFLEKKQSFFNNTLASYLFQDPWKNYYFDPLQERPPPHLFHVFDLYESACIKIYQKRFMDGLIRAYRAVDMLLEHHAWSKYQLRTKEADLSHLSGEQLAEFEKTISELIHKKLEIPREGLQNRDLHSLDLIVYFKVKNDRIYPIFAENFLQYKKKGKEINFFFDYLQKRRNSSHLIHGIGQYSRLMKIKDLDESSLLKVILINIDKFLQKYLNHEDFYFYKSLVQRSMTPIDRNKLQT